MFFCFFSLSLSAFDPGDYVYDIKDGGERFTIPPQTSIVFSNPDEFHISFDIYVTRVNSHVFETQDSPGAITISPLTDNSLIAYAAFKKKLFSCPSYTYVYGENAYYTIAHNKGQNDDEEMQASTSKCIIFVSNFQSTFEISATSLPEDYSLSIFDLNAKPIITVQKTQSTKQIGFSLFAIWKASAEEPAGKLKIASTTLGAKSLFSKKISNTETISIPRNSFFIALNPASFTFTSTADRLTDYSFQSSDNSRVQVTVTSPQTLYYTIYSYDSLDCNTIDIFAGSNSFLNVNKNGGNVSFTMNQRNCFLITSIDLTDYSFFAENNEEGQNLIIYDDYRKKIKTLTGTQGLEIAAHNVLVIVESKTEKSFIGSCGMHSKVFKFSNARSEYGFVQAQIKSKNPFEPTWTPNLKSTKPTSINYNNLHFSDGYYMIPVSKEVNLSFNSHSTVVFHNPSDFSGKIFTDGNNNYTQILGDTIFVGTNLTKACTITITPKSESKILSFSVLSFDGGKFSNCQTFDVYLGSDTYFVAGVNDGQPPSPVNISISESTSSCIWFTSDDTFLMNLDMNDLRGGSFVIRDFNMELTGTKHKAFTMRNFVVQTKGNDDVSNGYFKVNLESFLTNDERDILSDTSALITGISSYTKQSNFINGVPSKLTLFGVTFPEEEKQSLDLIKIICLIMFSVLALIAVIVLAIVTIYKMKKKGRVMMEENEDVETSDNITDMNAETHEERRLTRSRSTRSRRRSSADLEARERRTRRRANTHHRHSQIPYVPTARATLALEIDTGRTGSSSGRQSSQRAPSQPRSSGRSGRTRTRSYSSDDTVPVPTPQPGMPEFAQSPIACPPSNGFVSPQNSISTMSPYIQIQPSYNTLRKLDSSNNSLDFAAVPEVENPYKA